MIGNGAVWFSEVGETSGNTNIWVQRIIGIYVLK
jgi:hypothetical protein